MLVLKSEKESTTNKKTLLQGTFYWKSTRIWSCLNKFKRSILPYFRTESPRIAARGLLSNFNGNQPRLVSNRDWTLPSKKLSPMVAATRLPNYKKGSKNGCCRVIARVLHEAVESRGYFPLALFLVTLI